MLPSERQLIRFDLPMSNVVIRAEGLSKYYSLGTIGARTLREDTQRWWAKLRGRPDPCETLSSHGGPSNEDVWALRDVSFQVKQGEVLGIVGRNGAGKSTLLKILSRTTAPTDGRLLIRGRIGSLLEVGTGFHPELTGRENIYLSGAILGMKKAEIGRKIDEIIDFSGVERFVDTPVKRYSSGMYVRLGFAVAAHLEPEILVIDEVLAVGDADFQRKCLSKISQVSSEGRTVLFVSHNLVAVESLCTHGLLLSGGTKLFDGSIDDTLQQYYGIREELSRVSLSKRLDRQGNGQLRFENCFFSTDGVNQVSTLRCGEPAYFHLKYHAISDVSPLLLGFNVYDRDGYILLNFNNVDVNSFSKIFSGAGVLVCEIPAFPLRAGHYHGNVFCGQGKNILDWVQGAFSIDVVDTDFHGTGRLTDQGKFITQYKWRTHAFDTKARSDSC
jgi:lipopolysaccharide transport system ATP-binding protein